jgi:DNA-binding protein HU-beta
MKKANMVKEMAGRANITQKEAREALKALIESIQGSLRMPGDRIRIDRLGTFRVDVRKARKGVNPQNGKKIKIPKAAVPRFTPSKSLRETAKKAKG